MSQQLERFLAEHQRITRRWLLQVGAAGAVGLSKIDAFGAEPEPLGDAIAELESFFTAQSEFRDVSRGKPRPHSLPAAKKAEVGLTRDSWRLEVISDPDHPARVRSPMRQEDGSAFDFVGLMELAKQHAVRFPKVMTCLNIGCPLGMGIWEGVPLRTLLWKTQPTENLRRIFYYGYHNEDPAQMFRSSLPVGRVLEDPFDLPPVILCYKLNGHWLSSERGGPVRIVVPETYGFKSIKWLSTIVLSNISHANDTYAEKNNDVDSPLKTFAATLGVPTQLASDQPFAVTGYAQVGISGLSKVQVWIQREGEELASTDKSFSTAPWQDAQLLPPPASWGGDLPEGKIPAGTIGFSAGQPENWPLRLGKIHWAIALPGMPAGKYVLRSRTIDERGNAQPMPRPFRKSGHSSIERVSLTIEPA